MPPKNSRREKVEIRYAPAHNRKAGMGKYWKHLNNRKSRRKGNKYNKQMVEERIHWIM